MMNYRRYYYGPRGGAWGLDSHMYLGEKFEQNGPKHWSNKTVIEWMDKVRKAYGIYAVEQSPLVSPKSSRISLPPEQEYSAWH